MLSNGKENSRRLQIMAVEDEEAETDDIIPGPSSNRIFLTAQSRLDVSLTEHQVKGHGILASTKDVTMNAGEFASGCVLLQAAARGDLSTIKSLLVKNPHHINFRDCKCDEFHVHFIQWEFNNLFHFLPY
jgi:hypothetical protein